MGSQANRCRVAATLGGLCWLAGVLSVGGGVLVSCLLTASQMLVV